MADWNDQRTGVGYGTGIDSASVPSTVRDTGLRKHMLSIYNYMTSGVLLSGELFGNVDSEDIEWELVDATDGSKTRELLLNLNKFGKTTGSGPLWPQLIKGHPEVDVTMLKRVEKDIEELRVCHTRTRRPTPTHHDRDRDTLISPSSSAGIDRRREARGSPQEEGRRRGGGPPRKVPSSGQLCAHGERANATQFLTQRRALAGATQRGDHRAQRRAAAVA